MRPGRLDRILYVSPPNPLARADIFRLNFKKMAVNEEVDPVELAGMVSLLLLRLDRPTDADGRPPLRRLRAAREPRLLRSVKMLL